MTSASRRRILFATPFAPRRDGDNGGSRVMAGTLTALAAHHDVGLVYLKGPEDPDPASLASPCSIVRAVERPVPRTRTARWRRYGRLAGGLVAGRPLWPGRWWTDAFGPVLREVAETWGADVVQFEYHLMGQYLPFLSGHPALRVLVEHEPGEAAARESQSTATRWTTATLARADRRAWCIYERRVFRLVDRVVVFTDRDREALRPYAGSTPVVRIPFGVDVPAEPANPRGGTEPTLLFVGNFAHYPNEDAARRLVEHILPEVRRSAPAVRLLIVGAHPPGWLHTDHAAGIEVMGSVPDLWPSLDLASLVVAPIRLGGGMRVKVLEAMAAGKAVVCSPLAVEGLAVVHGRHVCLGDSDRAFADAVVALLRSGSARDALGHGARAWVSQHATWSAAACALTELYNAALIEKRTASAAPLAGGTAVLPR
jgi:glycosyltransferase involved in cell wall biosynthesis